MMFLDPFGRKAILAKLAEIEMKLNELSEQLTAINSRLFEASVEIVTKIEELKAALGDVDIPADAMALIDAISQQAATLADIVPNE